MADRFQVKVFMDSRKEIELRVLWLVYELKKKRKWTAFFRNAMVLYDDLSNKKIETLLVFFPWVDAYFKKLYFEPLSGRLDELTSLLKNQGVEVTQPIVIPAPRESRKEDKNILDNLEIKQAGRGDEDPNANFRIAMAMLQSDNKVEKALEYLTPKDIEYGVKKGKLPQDALKKIKKNETPIATTPAPVMTGKALVGADIELSAPNFDDLDLL